MMCRGSGNFNTKRRVVVIAFTLLITSAIVIITLAYFPCGCRTAGSDTHLLQEAELVEDAGEQGWGKSVSELVRKFDTESPDKAILICQLLHSSGPSIRSEGIVLSVKYNLASREVLQPVLNDRSVNYFLESNLETANEALLLTVEGARESEMPSNYHKRQKEWLSAHGIDLKGSS